MFEELKLNENVGAPQPDALARIARKDNFLQQPEAYRFRKNVSGQFVWITMEFLPCRNCCAQNPWATVVVREDAQADQISEELDFSYSHDTLTGLLNRSLFETDLRTLQSSEYDSMVCTYIDVVGLHEINNHLGHRSGDSMLCFIANAARKFFASSRIYRIGGDEFVILTPNQPPYSVWVSVDRMRAFLREKEYEISVGIQNTNDLHRLDDAINQAEAAMRQDKQAYYARNGQERQLRGLNEKLERTLTEKRDAEHFLRVLAPKFKSVFVVDLKTDRMRGVIVPDYFQKIPDTSGGSFLAVLQQYRDTQVQPAYRESLADLLDYNYIRSKVLTGDIVEHTYKKTDDTTFRVKVTPYSKSGSHIDETLWIFSDEGASLKRQKNRKRPQSFPIFVFTEKLCRAAAFANFDPLPVKKNSRKIRVCAAMKAPVGLSSGRTVLLLARWRGLAPTRSADFSGVQNKNNNSTDYGQSARGGHSKWSRWSGPQIFRVLTLCRFAGDGFHHQRLVLAIGDAIPFIGAAQHPDLCLALFDELCDDQRQEILALERVFGQILGQPACKALLGLIQKAFAEAPQVHAHRGIAGQVGPALAAVLGKVHAVLVRFNAGAFGHAVQGAVGVGHTHAAGHAAVLGDSVPEQVAYHAVVIIAAVLVGGQVIIHHPEGLRAVIIIGIDDCKGAVDEVLCSQNGVAGAPWLDTALRHGEACGQLIQLLECVVHVHHFGHAVADGLFEGLLDLVLDDEDHGLKACTAGIVEGIIHDDLPVGAYRVDLLHAAVTAAHASRHDHQYRFVHVLIPPAQCAFSAFIILQTAGVNKCRSASCGNPWILPP